MLCERDLDDLESGIVSFSLFCNHGRHALAFVPIQRFYPRLGDARYSGQLAKLVVRTVPSKGRLIFFRGHLSGCPPSLAFLCRGENRFRLEDARIVVTRIRLKFGADVAIIILFFL